MEAQEGRQACRNCGSLKRHYTEFISESVSAGGLVAAKGYKGGLSKRKGIRFETKDGDSFSVDRNRFVKLTQIVDHEQNRYFKRVVDSRSGEVIRDVDEPLSDHKGRGSAKKNKK
ncbi:hypothetical protein [Halomonas ventosae]|uniref:hypothetical protein n=1 Tax=Halomonas ventosae TaxID=229007 RepID=UPI00105D289C|nr:hypothetical protein [Halomonas ventosae]